MASRKANPVLGLAALGAAVAFQLIAAAVRAAPPESITPAIPDDGPLNPRLVPPAPMHEQVLFVPGDPQRPVQLEVTLYTPTGHGPFPLAVLNHGATSISVNHRGERFRYALPAYYFLSRGYAVALPMARGFAQSGGELLDVGCDMIRAGELNARDIAAAIGALATRPQIDGRRVVVVGQSFGGWTTLALAGLDVPGLRGIVGFSPAIRTTRCAYQDEAMILGARRFGDRAKVPSLWFYGDNDTVVPRDTWAAVFQAYSGGPRPAELVRVGTVGKDSHQMGSFPMYLPLWTGHLDAFLKKVGLPPAEIHPEYLPMKAPPPTHFAAIDDVAAVPGLSPNDREIYRRFLARMPPRAFVIAGEGGVSFDSGGFDPSARALEVCRKYRTSCRLYAVDNDVVW